ncbi:phospholipid carrier-dependent glycosyltransferase [Crocosphaera sp. XPORK-15E]|uniref:phospholipid carrier-dependent glycosyltransferase n=1 Tax=Crocosphaera sp. XPORK-15E TaxID=3110247 RepID=UPI002B1F23B1|nr:phospholipid carrier-dependent glycosyltransferase [Crocosphaera sp. XPORK-15E]MEA5532870.1 phospholipid carrier-dependent glycosyltransferase [Crocosphaera sp. XPORK-15E]
MNSSKFNQIFSRWFPLAMGGIFLFSFILRFWRLGQFNSFVFDEVYYAKYANYYLIGKDFFNSHPPLSQYIIAIGIWLGSHFPASPDITNNLTGSFRSTLSYRWINAFIGSFFPLIIGAIAYQLTHRRSYTIIVAFLAAMDGLFLVESRYALNNIYLVTFGLLGHLFFLLFLNRTNYLYLTISGIFFGSAAAVKWNGLGFLFGIYLIIFLVYFKSIFNKYLRSNQVIINDLGIFERIKSLKISLLGFNLLIIPLFIYSILWLPHLLMNPQYDWWEVHQKIWKFHHNIGADSSVHPYCSKWYTWLVMVRPVAYFYERTKTESGTIIHDVHAMANPVLLWLSTGAILTILFLILRTILRSSKQNDCDLFVYIIINYLTNLLPWLKVSRCTFFYHYMPSYVFAWLALGWIIEQCLNSQFVWNRRLGIIIILSIVIAFIYWLPIYLGLPLSPQGFKMRMLSNWI